MDAPSAPVPSHRLDHQAVGAVGSLLMTAALCVLAVQVGRFRDIPDSIAVVGAVVLFGSGLITFTTVVLLRKWFGHHGWHRAVRGALWMSAITALINLAVLVTLLVFAVRRFTPTAV